MTTPRFDSRRGEAALVLTAAAIYAVYVIYLTVFLGFDMFRSDVAQYWEESYNWRAPFSDWWVPGYPLLIALIRAVTSDRLPPLAVMSTISCASYLVAVWAAYRIAHILGVRQAAATALLFAVYPFVGLTYSVYPIADSTAVALLLLCVLSLLESRWRAFMVFAASATLVHKATWFFVPLFLIYAHLKHREARAWLPLTIVPLAVWIVAGALFHNDPLWFVRWGAENLVKSRGSLPVLDGIAGSLLTGSAQKMAKGALVLVVLLLAVATLVLSVRRRFVFGVLLSLPIAVMAVLINQYEIWAVIRFSRVLVIPLAYVAPRVDAIGLPAGRAAWASLAFVAFFLTNMAFGYYMARIFFS